MRHIFRNMLYFEKTEENVQRGFSTLIFAQVLEDFNKFLTHMVQLQMGDHQMI